MNARGKSAAPVAAVTARPAKRHRPLRLVGLPVAYVPGPTNRNNQKPMDSGARAEDVLTRKVNNRRYQRGLTGSLDMWRRPGIKHTRTSGAGMLPDAAMYMEDVARYSATVQPEIDRRVAYNVVVEIKSQVTSGSALHKIPTAITDLADLCDVKGIAGVLLLRTTDKAVSDAQIVAWKDLGATHCIAVITEGEIDKGLAWPQVIAIAKRRHRLARRVTASGSFRPYLRRDRYAEAYATRVASRARLARLQRAARTAPIPR